MAGLTSEGLEIKTLAEVKTSCEDRVKATFGEQADVSPRSVFGQLIGVFAPELADVWELAQQLYDAIDPDQVTGPLLRNIGALVGVRPLTATSSTTTVIATGDAGTLLEEGTLIEVDASGDRYETTEEAILAVRTLAVGTVTFADNDPSNDTMARTLGSYLDDGVRPGTLLTIEDTASNNLVDAEVESATDLVVTFVEGVTLAAEGPVAATVKMGAATIPVSSSELGPIEGFAYTIDTIVNPIDGWLTVINPADVVFGEAVEGDGDFRLRRETSFQIRGASVDNAILGNLLQIEGVQQALVISNRSDTTNVDGQPPHSLEAIIWPDLSDPDFDASIVELLWTLIPSGIQAYGSTVYLVTDSEGYEQSIGFSFATEIEMYVAVTITTDANYPADGDALVAAAMLEEGNGLTVSDDVLVWKFAAKLDEKDSSGVPLIPGIVDVTVAIETTPAPTSEANIAVAYRDIARFDSTRITVVST